MKGPTKKLVGPVHPHMRGAHIGIVINCQQIRGSSPHAWGTHLNTNSAAGDIRFIPTCVGHTNLRLAAR